jgi:demethylmenaquinone methyltransferase/2-methoxy-6-polyprenyl-1,4-benzoquinol methylase
MRRARRVYYDIFSRFYDRFVALHSRDRQGSARTILVERVPVQRGGSVLDLCTGTGTLLPHLQAKVGTGGRVVGVDFSPGMLKMAHKKIMSLANVSLVQADAGCLPFASETFNAVICSHVGPNRIDLRGGTGNQGIHSTCGCLKNMALSNREV